MLAIRSTTLALLALALPAAADVVDPHPPVVTVSGQDQNLDGVGDVLTNPSTAVQLGAGSEDRAMLEFDITSTLLGSFTDVLVLVRIDATDGVDVGSRQFDFVLYEGNGLAELTDYQIPGTLVGTASFDPAIDPYLWVELDVTAEVVAMMGQGVTHAGLRVEAASSPSGQNAVATPFWTELLFQDCPPQLWSPYCFGDGSGAACPCGNVGGAGGGCANSATQGAVLDAQGTPDSNGSGLPLQLLASGAPANRPGMFLSGLSAVAFPAGDGLLCTGDSVQRFELVFTDGAGAAATSVDIAATTGVQAGEVRYYQYWFRDTAGPCGGGFNFTNGLSVLWF